VVDALRQQKKAYQAAFTGAVSRQTEKANSDCEEQAAFDHWAADYSGFRISR
jgi:hypothetical protein